MTASTMNSTPATATGLCSSSEFSSHDLADFDKACARHRKKARRQGLAIVSETLTLDHIRQHYTCQMVVCPEQHFAAECARMQQENRRNVRPFRRRTDPAAPAQ